MSKEDIFKNISGVNIPRFNVEDVAQGDELNPDEFIMNDSNNKNQAERSNAGKRKW
jgi:hypothetical protein